MPRSESKESVPEEPPAKTKSDDVGEQKVADAEAVKKAMDIISEHKRKEAAAGKSTYKEPTPDESSIKEIVDKATSTIHEDPAVGKGSLKETVQKAVEETVKKEVSAEVNAVKAAGCPGNTSIPLTAEEKAAASKAQKI